MHAYRITDWGRGEFTNVPVPEPGPDEVLLEVRSAGLCRTDLNILSSAGGYWPEPPFTLGHEIAGVVVALGPGSPTVRVGDPVLVSAVYSCGACGRCRRGRDHECQRMTHIGYGVGLDGGLARYMVAKAIHLVPLGALDPRRAAPLGDAAATAFHAVTSAKESLWPGATAAVIGIGGLGGYAVQFLEQLTGASVLAVDTVPDRLELAQRYGAEDVRLFGADTPAALRDFGQGAIDVVFDFVGSTATVTAALDAIGVGGRIIVAGIGGAEVSLGWERMPRNSRFENTRGYTRADLEDVVALAAAGRIDLPQTHYSFSRVENALDDLRAARVAGRAVVLPDD
ncbi:alcohol dehydrogenase catalytic domain-containing protein [Nocardia alni]|uniref:alcohol dehydrogenase catalytic domain-containing protein n=1 Tax=Nocardia alni TaxID=2815723 RepID=UPI001C22E45B|nr:alcohol dehydrogenase catalytic domain-containing protein [Nocardia alni]